MTQTILYHVSPSYNNDSIYRVGINPYYAQSFESACWYVNFNQLAWSIAHCSIRHKLLVSDITVHVVKVTFEYMRRTTWNGRYKTALTYRPLSSHTASEALSWINPEPFSFLPLDTMRKTRMMDIEATQRLKGANKMKIESTFEVILLADGNASVQPFSTLTEAKDMALELSGMQPDFSRNLNPKAITIAKLSAAHTEREGTFMNAVEFGGWNLPDGKTMNVLLRITNPAF